MLPTALHGSPGKSHPPSTSLVNAEVTTASYYSCSEWLGAHYRAHFSTHARCPSLKSCSFKARFSPFLLPSQAPPVSCCSQLEL